MNVLELSEQEIVRRGSLDEMRRRGIDPFPAAEFTVTGYSDEIKETFADDAPRREVAVAGRIMGRRIMGKASFLEIQDSHGRIQAYVNRDEICPGEDKDLYNVVFKKLLDIGDFVGIRGYVFRTQTGEISVHAQELIVLGKSLRPLPVVKVKDGVTYDAFDDPEPLPPPLRRPDCQRWRQGYFRETHQGAQLHAPVFQRPRLHGSRDSHPPVNRRRCERPSLHHPPQLAQH